MRRITFNEDNRSGNLLHIELPGCYVNIRVNLTGPEGRPVTSVTISPSDNERSPEPGGYYWRLAADGRRVIRDPRPGMAPVKPSCQAYECLFCGTDIEQDEFGQWFDTTTDGLPDHVVPGMAAQAAVTCAAAPVLTGFQVPPSRRDAVRRKVHVPGGETLLRAARGWASDCEWLDSDDLAGLSDVQVYLGMESNYDGGWAAFVAAGAI